MTGISKPEVGVTIAFASDSGVLCLRRCRSPSFDELRACKQCKDSLATVYMQLSFSPSLSAGLHPIVTKAAQQLIEWYTGSCKTHGWSRMKLLNVGIFEVI